MPVLRSVPIRVLVIPLVVLALIGGGIGTSIATPLPVDRTASGPAPVAQADEPRPNLTVEAGARTPAPGMAGTHYYTVTIPDASDGAPLHSLVFTYSGTGVDLTEGLTHYRAELVRDPQPQNRTDIRLSNASLDATTTTVRYTFPDGRSLHAGDKLSVAFTGVENPVASGPIDVGVQLDPGRDGPRGVGTIDIEVPAPSISPQGVVGDMTRIGVHDPQGARGFIVAYTMDGTLVGTHQFDPEQDLHMDIGIGAFVEDRYQENGMVVRLVAHKDTDGDGEFDPAVDEPYTMDGDPIEATVTNAVFEGGTTTTPPSTTSTTTSEEDSTTTESDGTADSTTTSTTVPGSGVTGVLLALLGAILLARRG